MKRKLFAHEREIQSWRSVTLTTHRVIFFDSKQGFEGSTSILLEHLQCTRLTRSHQPIYAVVAGLCTALALFTGGLGVGGLAIATLVAAVLAGLVYLGTRQATLTLASAGGRIELAISSGTNARQQARDFLDVIENAASHALRHPPMSVAA